MKEALNFLPTAQPGWILPLHRQQSTPFFPWTFLTDTMEAGNHTSDDFMVYDSNIRHGSQTGYTLESFNSQ